MSYTQAEKLQIMMLCDIYKALEIKNNLDPDVIEEAVSSDNTWAIGWKYQSLHDGSETPEHVKLFVDTVDMYNILKYTYGYFTDDEKAEISAAVPHFGGIKHLEFPGFDGNNESEYLSVGYMLKLMGSFVGTHLTKNSHMRSVEIYRRMLDVFLPARDGDWTHEAGISKESFIAVLKARIHPSRRDAE